MATDTTEEKQQFDELVARLTPEEQKALLTWKPPAGLKETYRAGIALLSWLLGHKFAVTTSNLTLAVGQTRLQSYFEWETQSTHVPSWHSQTDDGKSFITDGLRKLSDGSLGKSPLDYKREERLAQQAANSQSTQQEQLTKSDATWRNMAQEACRYGSHSQQAQIERVYNDSVAQSQPWRTVYENCSKLVNSFKRNEQIANRGAYYSR
jgi:hypothetical protein